MAHNGKTTNYSGWNAIFSWIKYALTGKRDETKAVSQSSVSASSLVDLDARLKAVESVLASLDADDAEDLSVYKVLQSAKSSPTASGTDIAFIDTITQDENGDITATKKTVRSGTTSQAGVVQLEDSHTSTSTSKAATPKNVKEAYDLASGKYSKPSGGIPKTDLASDVQTSLGKADSALQSHQAVVNSNPTLSWGSTSKVGSVGGTNLQVTMPSNPAIGKQDVLPKTGNDYNINITGSANSFKRYTITTSGSSILTNPVRICASINTTMAAYSSMGLIIHFYSLDGSSLDGGILRVNVKCSSTANVVGSATAEWLYFSGNISKDSVIVGCLDGVTVYVLMRMNKTSGNSLGFTVLEEIKSSAGDSWDKINSTESTTLYSYASISDAESFLAGIVGKEEFDKSVISGQQTGTVYKALRADNADMVDGKHVVVGTVGSDTDTIYFW